MNMSKLFHQCPEFPTDVAVANIPILSYKKLKDNSSDEESKKLYEACREHGFFLLDLRDTADGERVLEDAETMFEISKAVFNLESEVLHKYNSKPPKDLMGYEVPSPNPSETFCFEKSEKGWEENETDRSVGILLGIRLLDCSRQRTDGMQLRFTH